MAMVREVLNESETDALTHFDSAQYKPLSDRS